MRTHKSPRLIALLCIVVFCMSPLLAMAENAPAAVEKAGDTVIRFTPEDFTGVFGGDDRRLAGIVIAELPVTGSLSYAGRDMLPGEAALVEMLDTLVYVPSMSGERTVSFDFLPVYDDGTIDGLMTVSLTMQAIDNQAPMAQDIEVKTYKNTEVTGVFRATDPEGDALTYRITSKPRRGEVEVTSDGRFKYTPFRNKTGKDSMTYVAVDAYGNLSAEAKINVQIDKLPTKTTYSDLAGHPAQYAALRLAGEEVYTGTQMCGNYYFKPGETVTRAEMITMVVKAIGLDVTPVTVTGFYDDASIPDWFKPYAQAALKAGVISGVRSSDGRTVVNANTLVTFDEAATMLNNAIRPAAVELDGTVQVWSAQAIANLDAAGIFDDIPVSGGEISAGDPRALTRGEVAMMLVRAMDAYEVTKTKSGLLSWVFGW